MVRVRHVLALGVLALAAVVCVALSAPKGDPKMPLMPEDRNRLVVYAEDPEAPPAPSLGVAIRFAAEGEASFKVGEHTFLYGSFRADRTLIQASGGEPKSFVFLTLIRTDKPYGQTLQLYTPTVRVAAPPDDPAPGPDYREGASFRVDLVKLFDLPDEPGRFTIQASIGPHFSDRLEFEIAAR